MIVNEASISAIYLNLKSIYNDALLVAPSVLDKLATTVPSGGAQNDYPWIGSFPMMREWVDEKQIKNLTAYKYTIVNKDFESTISVRRNSIEDDSLGIYNPQAKALGYAAKSFSDQLVFTLINGGFSNLCYDGKPFFSDSHPVGSGTVSNTSANNLLADTLSNAKSGYGAARTAILKMKNNNGYSLNLKPNLLVVPPALESVAMTLIYSDRLEDNKANPFKGTAEVLVDNRINNDKYWFLFDTTQPLKPLIYQERKAPVFVQQILPDSSSVFLKGEYLFSVEARGNAGYGFYQMAYGSTGT